MNHTSGWSCSLVKIQNKALLIGSVLISVRLTGTLVGTVSINLGTRCSSARENYKYLIRTTSR